MISWTRTVRLQRFLTHITESVGHLQVFLVSHLTYLVQLLYLGNCQDLNIMNLGLNCWFSQCYNTRILTAKLSPYYFIIIQLMVYKRTITRFIADDKVVYQRVRQATRWLQTTAEHDVVWSMSAGDHGELCCAHLNGECQFRAKFHELISAFLACPPDWAQGPKLLRAEHSLPLPG